MSVNFNYRESYFLRSKYNLKSFSPSFFLFIFLLFPLPSQSFTYHRLRPGCELKTNEDWSKTQALLLNKAMTEIIHPEVNDSVLLMPTEEIVLACPGSKFKFGKPVDFDTSSAKCSRGTQIVVGDKAYDFNEASCEKLPKTSTKIVGTCLGKDNLLEAEIGFDVETNFIKLITICFDNDTLSTVYSLYQATSKIVGRQHGFPRPSFTDAGFYHDIKVWNLYKRPNQRDTISRILGSKELGEKYIQDDSGHYLARGHLTAKADFIYGAEQMGTFYYINVAPQWQIINAGNWAALEDSVRKYVADNNLEISICTIPHGVAELPDVNNELKELYLYYNTDLNNNEETLISVPKFYIKIMFDKDNKKGVAFVTINNPYIEEITPDYILCDDICEKYPWLTWDQENYEKGYSYCCSYDQLKEEIPDVIPELPIEYLL